MYHVSKWLQVRDKNLLEFKLYNKSQTFPDPPLELLAFWRQSLCAGVNITRSTAAEHYMWETIWEAWIRSPSDYEAR